MGGTIRPQVQPVMQVGSGSPAQVCTPVTRSVSPPAEALSSMTDRLDGDVGELTQTLRTAPVERLTRAYHAMTGRT